MDRINRRGYMIVSLPGDTNIHGPESMRFYTKAKVVTTRWPKRGEKVGYVGMNFPTNA